MTDSQLLFNYTERMHICQGDRPVSRVITAAPRDGFYLNNYDFRRYPNLTSLSLAKTRSVWYDGEEPEID